MNKFKKFSNINFRYFGSLLACFFLPHSVVSAKTIYCFDSYASENGGATQNGINALVGSVMAGTATSTSSAISSDSACLTYFSGYNYSRRVWKDTTYYCVRNNDSSVLASDIATFGTTGIFVKKLPYNCDSACPNRYEQYSSPTSCLAQQLTNGANNCTCDGAIYNTNGTVSVSCNFTYNQPVCDKNCYGSYASGCYSCTESGFSDYGDKAQTLCYKTGIFTGSDTTGAWSTDMGTNLCFYS
ncbi:MAG: hypothetical protein LBJ18_01990 [Rickettsiales bacterium]|jgi:hypothetical protein|nr:hypothetical protein [Rickettsiales bacterium]